MMTKEHFTDKIWLLYHQRLLARLSERCGNGCEQYDFDTTEREFDDEFHPTLQALLWVRDVILNGDIV